LKIYKIIDICFNTEYPIPFLTTVGTYLSVLRHSNRKLLPIFLMQSINIDFALKIIFKKIPL